MSHIKYKILELNIKFSRAVQKIGYIGTSISYFWSVNLKGPLELHAYNESLWHRQRHQKGLLRGMPYWIIQFPFIPINIVIKLFWYCSNSWSLTWSNKNYSRVDSTYNSTNAILCIGLGPRSVILTDPSILFYSIRFLLPAWTWHSCILKSSFANSCVISSSHIIIVFSFNLIT